MLSLAAVALVSSIQASVAPLPERRYADELRSGVAALTAGERAKAPAAFGAAGALAPEAPLWPLHLAAARDEALSAPELGIAAAGPWQLVSDFEHGWPRFSPDGGFIVTNSACIWDAK